MPIEITPITDETLTDALPLIAAYQRFYEIEDIDDERNRSFFSRFISPSDSGWLLGARDEDRLVGFGCYWRHRDSLTATETVLMNDLYVEETARGQGAGRALLEAGVELVRGVGAPVLEWATSPDNSRAQTLYDSTGAGKRTWLEYTLEV